jgi:hypothetical protein
MRSYTNFWATLNEIERGGRLLAEQDETETPQKFEGQ